MVEIFRTDIQQRQIAAVVQLELLQLYPGCKINFDLDDCDRILRIESTIDIGKEIETILANRGFFCEELF